MVRPPPPAALPLDSPDELEAQFYQSLRRGDIERLMAVWADDDEIVCVHPGGARVIGGAAIRASFEALLAGGVLQVQTDQVRRLQTLGAAVHHLVERIDRAGATAAWVLATNVYLKTAQGWRMVAHHASPGLALALAPPMAGETPSTLH